MIPVLLGLTAVLLWGIRPAEKGSLMEEGLYGGRVRAPELEGGAGWLNVDRPLRLADLKGKVVLLDFWTYCCINCMHVIPDLKRLEAKYPRELVVIGVHSAKFLNEREADNIRQAILRYEIAHPVVNDQHFRIWRSYGVRAWPTLVLIDPEGYVASAVSGEGHYDRLDQAIVAILAHYDPLGKIDRSPLTFALEAEKGGPGAPAPFRVETGLAFPGKVLADTAGGRLFIADSNHNRIVVADLNGKVLDVAGSGAVGKDDGAFEQATFDHPQGMALSEDGTILYVADTENHLLRALDLKARRVRTLAGTGAQARGGNASGEGTAAALNSPWDLVRVGETLYIAMAGPHQIWSLHLKTLRTEAYAGSGREEILDGPRRQAALAQPSGITTTGSSLYFADSEVSAVRAVDLGPPEEVKTLVGRGLFEFGDQDGKGEAVRLQHPLGVAHHQGKIYVADTYNHKVKVLDPATREVRTLLGGERGLQDGVEKEARFYEPGGLSVSGGKLYIADTNNHRIRVADLATGEVRTMEVKF